MKTDHKTGITARPIMAGQLSPDRVVRIGQMVTAMDRAGWGLVMLAMAIGDELMAEKAERPHGEFVPWLKSNMQTMGLRSVRTAQEYMALAENRPAIEQAHKATQGITSMRAAHRLIGRGGTDDGDQDQGDGVPEPTEPISAKPINPRSKRAFAMQHIPPELRITPEQLRKVLEWYEGDGLGTEYRSAIGTKDAKPRKPKARVSAVVRPKAKRDLERIAKRNDMTQGQLIETLLSFADQVEKQTKANKKGGDR